MGAEQSAESTVEQAAPSSPPPEKIELPLRNFTLQELRKYDGTNPMEEHKMQCPIYLAVNKIVFDVTLGKSFYGPSKTLSLL